MSEKRKRLQRAQQLIDRLVQAGYGERTYEHHMPELSAQWKASGEVARTELMTLVAQALASKGSTHA